MGAIVSISLRKMLKKYTYNFSSSRLKLRFFPGKLKIESLIVNDARINKILFDNQIPFKLKFGVLKKCTIDASIFGIRLEKMEVKELILIAGPARVKDDKTKEDKELKLYALAVENMLKEIKNKEKPTHIKPDKLFEDLKRKFKNKNKEREKNKRIEEGKAPHQRVSETIMKVIKYFLEFNIFIENITFIYEDNLGFIYTKEPVSTFNIIMHIKEFSFDNKNIKDNLKVINSFKGVFDIKDFIQASQISRKYDDAYWDITVSKMTLSFSSGNPLFIADNEVNDMLSPKWINKIIQQFYDTLVNNKMQNTFDLLNIREIKGDIILFYQNKSKIPLHALYTSFYWAEFVLKLELNKIIIFMDVLAFFMSITRMFKLSVLKPKFRILNSRKQEEMANSLKFDKGQKYLLRKLNLFVIQEYILEAHYYLRYSGYLKGGLDPDLAMLLTIKEYCSRSKIYRLLFGKVYPSFIDVEIRKLEIEMQKKQLESVLDVRNDTGGTSTKNCSQIKYKLEQSILKRVRICVRSNLSIKINILSNTKMDVLHSLIVQKLQINIDSLQSTPKTTFDIQIPAIHLDFNKESYPEVKKHQFFIFRHTKRVAGVEEDDTMYKIVKFEGLSLLINFDIIRESKTKRIYVVEFDINLNKIIIEHYPVVFEHLFRFIMNIYMAANLNFGIKMIKHVIETNNGGNNSAKTVQRNSYQTIKQDTIDNGNRGVQSNKNTHPKYNNIETAVNECDRSTTGRKYSSFDRNQNLNKITPSSYYNGTLKTSDDYNSANKRFANKRLERLYKNQNCSENALPSYQIPNHRPKAIDHSKDKNNTSLFSKTNMVHDIYPYLDQPDMFHNEKFDRVMINIDRLLNIIMIRGAIKYEGIDLSLFDDTHIEAIRTIYQRNQISIDIDMVYDKVTMIKGFGLEVHSCGSIKAIRLIIQKAMYEVERMQEAIRLKKEFMANKF